MVQSIVFYEQFCWIVFKRAQTSTSLYNGQPPQAQLFCLYSPLLQAKGPAHAVCARNAPLDIDFIPRSSNDKIILGVLVFSASKSQVQALYMFGIEESMSSLNVLSKNSQIRKIWKI